MPKYYVKSGELKCVLISESPRFAALDSLERFTEGSEVTPVCLGTSFYVNQSGFSSEPEIQFDTEEIILEAGWEIQDDTDSL
tara:strand:+ start:3238 stop:3483 length:246 start_codon:yes stop_codon:yes gene_type:complete